MEPINLSFKNTVLVLHIFACHLEASTVPYPEETLTIGWMNDCELSILRLNLLFMNYLSLNIFSIVSSLNTCILNNVSTKIKFHTQNFNHGISVLFQEKQLGKGIWVGRPRYNISSYYIFMAILDNLRLPLYIDFFCFFSSLFFNRFSKWKLSLWHNTPLIVHQYDSAIPLPSSVWLLRAQPCNTY